MSKTLTVLCPTGHRIKVKLNSTTPLLNVLDEVCKKRNLEPNLHTLSLHDKILELSLSYHLSGIPNLSTIELVERSSRDDSECNELIDICLAHESGKRYMAAFYSSCNLMAVLNHWNLWNDKSIESVPVIVYLQREILGLENLTKTTLRNLGLYKGKALLRFIDKSPIKTCEILSPFANLKFTSEQNKIDENESITNLESEYGFDEKSLDSELHNKPNIIKSLLSTDNQNNYNISDNKSMKTNNGSVLHLLDKEFMTCAFSSEEISDTSSFDNLDSDFFEWNINDIKLLHQEQQDRLKEFVKAEELVTERIRFERLEASKKSKLEKYKKTVLRIHFPFSSIVLQSTFSVNDTISDVLSRVRNYILNDSQEELIMFTTPPKVIHLESNRLIDCNLVPSAIVYVSCKNDHISLDSNVLNHLSSYSAAQNALRNVKMIRSRKEFLTTDVSDPKRSRLEKDKNKIPSWFTKGKK